MVRRRVAPSRTTRPHWCHSSFETPASQAPLDEVWHRALLTSNLRIHLQQIPIGIPEEQRAMAEWLVGRRLQQIDTVPHQLVGAAIDVIGGYLERELQRRA